MLLLKRLHLLSVSPIFLLRAYKIETFRQVFSIFLFLFFICNGMGAMVQTGRAVRALPPLISSSFPDMRFEDGFLKGDPTTIPTSRITLISKYLTGRPIQLDGVAKSGVSVLQANPSEEEFFALITEEGILFSPNDENSAFSNRSFSWIELLGKETIDLDEKTISALLSRSRFVLFFSFFIVNAVFTGIDFVFISLSILFLLWILGSRFPGGIKFSERFKILAIVGVLYFPIFAIVTAADAGWSFLGDVALLYMAIVTSRALSLGRRLLTPEDEL